MAQSSAGNGARLTSELTRRVLILDGATGTELTRRGVPTPLPLWSTAALLDAPNTVRAIHVDYAAAGADILVANTFRTNVRTLRAAEMLARGAELNALAVQLARQAANHARRADTIFIAASVAPVEDCYHPERVPDAATLRDEHGRMLDWLVEAGPDLVWIETMNTVREAAAAASAAHEHDLPCVVSFVVNESGDLLSGEPLEDAVATVESADPLAIGLNCIPPDGVTRNLPRLRAATKRPLAAYAHIGNPEPISGWSFSQTIKPAAYATAAMQWIDIGARIVGGCCGTTPQHIRTIHRRLESEPRATH